VKHWDFEQLTCHFERSEKYQYSRLLQKPEKQNYRRLDHNNRPLVSLNFYIL